MTPEEDIKFLKETTNQLNNLMLELSGYLSVMSFVIQKYKESDELLPMIQDTLNRAMTFTSSIQKYVYQRAGHGEQAVGQLMTPGVAAPAYVPSPVSPPQPLDDAPPAGRGPVFRPAPGAARLTPGGGFPRGGGGGGGGGGASLDPGLMGGKQTILVVDDEKNILLLVEMMLRIANYRVLKATTGTDAIACYISRMEEIDLVILDFAMGDMNGREVFRQMVRINPAVKVLMSSGFAEMEDMREMLAEGLSGYIPKPYTKESLLHQVKSVL
jgi:CheY-like chemotaxis protein